MGDYKDVLNRLIAYRKKTGATQEQMGQKLGLSQEQYSYLENGKTKITDSNLKDFLRTGWDIDYLITGVEIENDWTDLENIFSQFQDGEERSFAMKITAELLLEKGKQTGKSAKASLDLLEAVLKMWERFSMSRFVREELLLSQTDMAEKLGVGIKKYREMERELRFPDAELLLSLYAMSGYQPLLFIDFYDRRLMSMNMVWNLLTKEEKSHVLNFIRSIKSVL